MTKLLGSLCVFAAGAMAWRLQRQERRNRRRLLAELIAARLSNREIAEKLFLSEGSVKQYVNQLYSKLCIEGDTRTKRKRLAEMMGKS